MRPALGYKILVVIARWSHWRGLQINKMTRRFSLLDRKTMGCETKGGRINGVVTRRGFSVYKQKKNIYILKDNCRMFTKTVIQNNGNCICERKDSRLIGNNVVKKLEIEVWSPPKANTRQGGKLTRKTIFLDLFSIVWKHSFKKNL